MTQNTAVVRPPERRRGFLRALLSVAVSVGLVGAVLHLAGGQAVVAALARADPLLVALGLVLVQVQMLLSAFRWRFTARRLGVDLPFGHAVGEYYLSGLLNMVLPGGVAGDAMRAYRQGGTRPFAGPAALAVLLERVAGQVAFAAVGAIGVAAWIVTGGERLPTWTGLALAAVPLALAVVAAAVLAAERLRPGRTGARSLRSALRAVFLTKGAWLIQSATSLALALSYVAMFALCGWAIGAPLPLLGIVTLIPLALLSMLIPASVGGWGLREGTAALLWPLAGLAAAEGAATGALYGLVALAGALPGALVPLVSRRA